MNRKLSSEYLNDRDHSEELGVGGKDNIRMSSWHGTYLSTGTTLPYLKCVDWIHVAQEKDL
jgi:hypothetical protein